MSGNKPIELLVVGAGNRGQCHAKYTEHFPERAVVVGVAEPRAFQRDLMRQTYSIPEAQVFSDWWEAARAPKFADAVMQNDQSLLDTSADNALASHRIVFAAERARRERRVVDL